MSFLPGTRPLTGETDKYFSELVWRAYVGKVELDEPALVGSGLNASRGPREGVVAVREPDGWAVKKVPLPVSGEHSSSRIGVRKGEVNVHSRGRP